MGIDIHSFFSLYSFLMGTIWFAVFVLLGFLVRKTRFGLNFSFVPLVFILVMTLFRMVFSFHVPVAYNIASERVLPVLFDIIRFEIVLIPIGTSGFLLRTYHVLIGIWISVSTYLIIRHIQKFDQSREFTRRAVRHLPPCAHTRSVLKELTGADMTVFRTAGEETPLAAGSRPFMVMPDVAFPEEELRVILKHEWKHYHDKDYLVHLTATIIRYILWWHPCVHLLHKNIYFALELKADSYAVNSEAEYVHLKSAVKRIHREARMNPINKNALAFSTFVTPWHDLRDRYKVLAARKYVSPEKRRASNIIAGVVLATVFVSSYFVTFLPRQYSDISAPADCFIVDYYYEDGGVYRAGENFIMDNGDGTFSLYIDGLFASYVLDVDSYIFSFLPIRIRRG